jgi:hypothetical protein
MGTRMNFLAGNGRKVDVIIDDVFILDARTCEMILSDVIMIHADPGFKEIIEKVEGIELVAPTLLPSNYNAVIDRRYDREFVKKEVEAAILCAEPKPIDLGAALRAVSK